MSPDFELSPLGDRAVVVTLGDRLDEATFHRVHAFARLLQEEPIAGQVEYVPALTSVTIYYDPLITDWLQLCAEIQWRVAAPLQQTPTTPRLVEIPVCYHGNYAPDLQLVAEHNQLAPEDVIAIHTGVDYLVHMIGFAPGFPYLGGMSPRIAAPRRSTPRLKVAAGSVGIAGTQTGIYSLETPGGWQIIGRTPLRLFRPSEQPPSLLAAGDRVRFHPISPRDFDRFGKADP